MKITSDNIFGIHEAALKFRERRAEVLASNIANADTPGYKARDIEFGKILSDQLSGDIGMVATSEGHQIQSGYTDPYEIKYRIPLHGAVDKNTVNIHMEQAEFSKNSVQYQSTLEFLDSKIKNIIQAIRGD